MLLRKTNISTIAGRIGPTHSHVTIKDIHSYEFTEKNVTVMASTLKPTNAMDLLCNGLGGYETFTFDSGAEKRKMLARIIRIVESNCFLFYRYKLVIEML